MASCCAGGCNCVIEAGSNVSITGNGSTANPYIITSSGGGGGGGGGTTWYAGASNPAADFGAIGDWYINTTTGQAFEKTGATTWAFRLNMIGPQGPTGPAGPAGSNGTDGTDGAPGPAGPAGESSQWLGGSGVPSAALGEVGWWYIDTDTAGVYQKTDETTWTFQMTLTGGGGGSVSTVNGQPGPDVVLDADDVGAQPASENLTEIAAITPVDGDFLRYEGSTWVRKTSAAALTAMNGWPYRATSTATIATAAAKTATIAGYTPAAGDIVAVVLTAGNTVSNPTLNLNGAGALPIYVGGAVATAETAATAANGVWWLSYGTTRWNMLAPAANYALASQAEMEAGTATTVRWMTPERVKQAILALAPSGGGASAPNVQTGTTYTFVLSDANKRVEGNNAAAQTFTIPTNAAVAFPVGTRIEVEQYGAGQITINGPGVTLRASSSLLTRTQYSVLVLFKRATDEWVISGDMQ
jgi:hypothetical protein